MLRIVLILSTLWLAACSTTSSMTGAGTSLAAGRWALLPFVNHTDTPQAGLAAEAVVDHLVRARGQAALERYPVTLSKDTLFDPAERKVVEEAQAWAKKQGIRYGLGGSVQEWRYKVGIDGEPAVGVTLELVDLDTGAIVWSAAGARSGWSREALSAVAQKLLADLLTTLPAPAPDK
ncbi:MAG: penicillin-binding protein activator LpoB [Rhodocyclaceae bacterium]|jgi:TolB-like protein|nr:penicillin-binding protein activator LpoB [Rhodocyclaceae bacterium]